MEEKDKLAFFDAKGRLMDLIIVMHDELTKEHVSTKPRWFGLPSRRHHEIMASNRTLRDLFRRLANLKA